LSQFYRRVGNALNPDCYYNQLKTWVQQQRVSVINVSGKIGLKTITEHNLEGAEILIKNKIGIEMI